MLKPPEFESRVEEREKLKKGEFRIALISDTQDLENPADITKKLAGETLDMAIHIGDLYAGPLSTKLVMEGKRLFALKKGLTEGELTPEEEKRFQEITSEEVFKKFIEQGDPPHRAYMKTIMLRHPELLEENFQIEREKIKGLLEAMKKLDIPIKHSVGNVDIADSRRQKFIQEEELKEGIETILEPSFIDLGEFALIIWPYQNIDPKREKEIHQALEKKAEELAQKAKGKKQIIVVGHEHLLKGPKEYGEKVKAAGFKEARLPRLQPAPSTKHIIHLLQKLPIEAKITYVFGHLHDPREAIKAGMSYLKEEKGKFKFKVGIGKEGKKFDMIYLPQGKVGFLKITPEGVEFEER